MRHTPQLSRSALAAWIAIAACGGDNDDGANREESRVYYEDEASAALGAEANQARCVTCHSDDGSPGFSGASFRNIAYKDGYKGTDTDLLGAVNACVTGWMGGPALTADDSEYASLLEFFESISDPSATSPNTLVPEVLTDEAAYETAYALGDAMAGAEKYASFCGNCHDKALVVGTSAAPPQSSLAGYSAGRIAQQVRTSGPPPSGSADEADSTPGPMPFFEPDELSPADLADIIAYVRAS